MVGMIAAGDSAKAELEAEDNTENPDPWSTNVATKSMKEVRMESVMFEAADPQVFEWCIKNYGVDGKVKMAKSEMAKK